MTKKCKICNKANSAPMQKTCSYDCANIYLKSPEGVAAQDKLKANRLKREAARERQRQRQRKLGIRPLAEWLKLAQVEFNRYIRLRDHKLPCISCDVTHAPQWAAGHYRTVGGSPENRFNEDNVHKQCNKHCNCELSGNILEYRIRLIRRIGHDRVDVLEGEHQAKNYTIEDAKEIRTKYKRMANDLEKLHFKLI